MNARQELIERCQAKALAVLEEAKHAYGFNRKVGLFFDLKGNSAGKAYCGTGFDGKRGPRPFLRFNLDAGEYLIENCIAHEIAHLVAWEKFHARGHERSWKRVCLALGGNGERCHSLVLPSARRVTRYRYTLRSGRAIEVGPKIHAGIQSGRRRVTRDTKELIDESCSYERVVK